MRLIFSQHKLETYNCLDQIPMKDSINSFDFLYVINGIIEITLERAIKLDLNDTSDNVILTLRLGEYIDH